GVGGEISGRGRRSAIVPARVAAIDLNRLRAHFDVAMAKARRASQLTLLGHSDARLPASPAEARLETFPNPAPQRDYRIHFETDRARPVRAGLALGAPTNHASLFFRLSHFAKRGED